MNSVQGKNKHYDLILSGRSIKIFEEVYSERSSVSIQSLTIANSKDLLDIDFACWTSKKNLAPSQLKI